MPLSISYCKVTVGSVCWFLKLKVVFFGKLLSKYFKKTMHVTICCKLVLLGHWSDYDLLTSHVHVLQSKPTIDSHCDKQPQEVSRRFTGRRVFVTISSFIVVFIQVHVCTLLSSLEKCSALKFEFLCVGKASHLGSLSTLLVLVLM